MCIRDSHYRESWEYTENQLAEAAAWTRRLQDTARRAGPAAGSPNVAVRAALEEDLDSPRALRLLEESLTGGDDNWRDAAEILGLRLDGRWMPEGEMKKALGWRAPFSDGGGS